MQMTTQYIISQIITIVSYTCLATTYCIKKRKVILALSFSANFLNICAYFLLGAYTSSLMCGVSILRDIVFIIDSKINGKSNKITKKDIFILAGVYVVSLTAIAVTFKGFGSLMYTLAAMLYTYSIWQKNNKVYRYLGIPCGILVLVDCFIIKSIFGFILQSIVVTCTIIGACKSKKESLEPEKIKSLQDLNVELKA